MDPLLGNRCVLGERLGGGSLGEVYAGTDEDGREFAVKLLRAELIGNTGDLARLLREQSALLGLTQPNLVTLHNVVVDDETVALVLDRVPGGALSTTTARPPAEVARIAAGIAAALATVHDAGVAHGDVKPANVLMDGSGAVPSPRLTDAGVSRLAPPSPPTASMYSAPEILAGGGPTPATDLYSLGVVTYELCRGGGFARDIPDALRDVLRLLLSTDPSARPAAERIAAALAALAPPLTHLSR
ncbi:serine/threonine-protein kinase [Amycolatopsis sp. H20-H5]|uniref:serine/threonine-protein kinase n=1 Tax=Amycolatopsis sp. H20-H5 TaxID=3046309 RepID=UPI002DBBB985|nr:serine/threonine-protein kinase [Amycolatopsis sp. H20-H5]MEC3981396.1 serine/threonine-protein kinase [Amycolatopsis sp. H20-H5]